MKFWLQRYLCSYETIFKYLTFRVLQFPRWFWLISDTIMNLSNLAEALFFAFNLSFKVAFVFSVRVFGVSHDSLENPAASRINGAKFRPIQVMRTFKYRKE